MDISHDKHIKHLIDTKQLTVEGYNWLVTALDPFNDSHPKPVGYPDSDNAPSLTQMFTSTYTVSKPASAAGNWDLLIWNSPFSFNASGVAASAMSIGGAGTTITYQTTPPTAIEWGNINFYAADTGQELFPNNTAALWAPTNFESNTMSYGDIALDKHRIVAMGIEARNTTSDMYKQGSVVVGHQSSDTYMDNRQYVDGDGVTATYFYPSNGSNAPAWYESTFDYLPNSVRMEAKQGAYAVVHLGSGLNRPGRDLQLNPFLSTESNAYGGFGLTAIAATTAVVSQSHSTVNTDTTSMLFTGLSNESTITVTVRWYIERFPVITDGTDSGIMISATPSPPFDPLALQLYSRIIAHMPAAVPVRENNAGTWFKRVLKAMSKVLPVAGMAIEPVLPGSTIMANALSDVARLGSNMIHASNPQIVNNKNANKNSRQNNMRNKKKNVGPYRPSAIPR